MPGLQTKNYSIEIQSEDKDISPETIENKERKTEKQTKVKENAQSLKTYYFLHMREKSKTRIP